MATSVDPMNCKYLAISTGSSKLVALDKLKGRDIWYSGMCSDPHEKRFLSFNVSPEVLSTNKKSISPDF